mmetsp:Transcript_754/g.1238  ORF Transcript_754/g.1238 Transcript_754/m.1238 type:complete len:258 (-) Transcript_754:910-1683(-)
MVTRLNLTMDAARATFSGIFTLDAMFVGIIVVLCLPPNAFFSAAFPSFIFFFFLSSMSFLMSTTASFASLGSKSSSSSNSSSDLVRFFSSSSSSSFSSLASSASSASDSPSLSANSLSNWRSISSASSAALWAFLASLFASSKSLLFLWAMKELSSPSPLLTILDPFIACSLTIFSLIRACASALRRFFSSAILSRFCCLASAFSFLSTSSMYSSAFLNLKRLSFVGAIWPSPNSKQTTPRLLAATDTASMFLFASI